MEKRKMSTLKVIKRQMQILIEEKKSYVFLLAFLVFFVGGALPVVGIYLPKVVIDSFAQDDVYNKIIILSAISLVLAVIFIALKVVGEFIFLGVRCNEFINSNRKFIGVDYANVENPKFLDRIERCSSALGSNNQGFEGTYHKLYAILPLIGSLLAYLYILGKFNFLIVVAIFVSAFVSIFVSGAISKYRYKRQDEVDRLRRQKNYFYNTAYDFAYGKDIRVYQLEDKIKDKYQHRIISLLTVLNDIKRRNILLGLIDLLFLLLQDGLAYFLIIDAYFHRGLSLGDVSLYLGATIALSTTIRAIAENVSQIREFTMYTADYLTYIDDQSLHSVKGQLARLEDTLEIEFVDVSFKYPNTEKWIFQNLNFKINKGEKIAIVGTNGAGKTTLIKLITGLFSPTSGKILINGIASEEFDLVEYEKMFGVVFQDFHIFAGTVIENIAGNDTSEIEYAKQCIEAVGMKEKIESLPNGYETQLLKVIDPNGVELSGGQNQKLAIARALYKRANMVILDEPTAALDALAEAEIYQHFDKLVEGKTAVYVSHRLSSTKFCDYIALFTPDGLSEYGTHDELMNLKGQYYQMFIVQGKYYQGGEEHE